MNERFGLKVETISKIQSVFATFPYIEEAILYGSRAMGNYRNGSDIDLTFIKVDQDTTAISLTKIGVALDELDLPYKFYLSFYKNINNPDLVNHINRNGTSFYKK